MAFYSTGCHEGLDGKFLHQSISPAEEMPASIPTLSTSSIKSESQCSILLFKDQSLQLYFNTISSSSIPLLVYLFYPLLSPMLPSPFTSPYMTMHTSCILKNILKHIFFILSCDYSFKHSNNKLQSAVC